MPSSHPILALRIPTPLLEALKARAKELGTSPNTYVLLILSAELGFGNETNNDVTKWLLNEARSKAAQS